MVGDLAAVDLVFAVMMGGTCGLAVLTEIVQKDLGFINGGHFSEKY